MVEVRVPATSANIGPGFDALGIAFKYYNYYEFEEINQGLEFEGFLEEFCNKDNIVYKSMERCFNECGYKPRGLKITQLEQNVPISRGLGSSSSCIVAGLIGANKLAGNPLTQDELFSLAVEIEGHPDNVAPAFFGDLITSVMEGSKVYYNKVNIQKGIKFVALIPNFKLSTEKARSVLPKEVNFKDAVYNLSRVALMISAFASGEYDLLKVACNDKLHEQYRGNLINNFEDIVEQSKNEGALCTFISGAGPTIMSIIKDENTLYIKNIEKYLEKLDDSWQVIELEVDSEGATIV